MNQRHSIPFVAAAGIPGGPPREKAGTTAFAAIAVSRLIPLVAQFRVKKNSRVISITRPVFQNRDRSF